MRHNLQRGLSLVELMIGLALGLFITAAGFSVLVGQWREHRSAITAMRLMQDLRSASDVITRDLRRAGHWADPTVALSASVASGAVANPYAAFVPASAASDAARFAYSRDAVENHLLDGNEQFGLRLRNGAIELLLGAGNWQALTDAGTLQVTAFSLEPSTQVVSLLEHCARPCLAGASACDARIELRSLIVRITARATDDASLVRQLTSQVRIRNDGVIGACPV
jgi:type IV pilus assembly protein PilW